MKKIAWEKWYDFDEDFEDDGFDEEDDDNENEEGRELNIIDINSLLVRTPLGNYAPYEPLNPSNMFECWILHTNFDITKEEAKKLEKVCGIEVMKIMTRYRIFFGIGKMFDFRQVREDIIQALSIDSNEDFVPKGSEKLNSIFKQMGDCKNWAIFVGKDGTIIAINSDEFPEDEYNNKLKELESLKNGDIFIYSEK